MSSNLKHDALTSICVCTPSEAFLDSICDFLSDAGYGCLPAASGPAAVRLCRYMRVDVLVLDVAFEDGTAVDLLSTISEPEFPEVDGVLVLVDRKANGEELKALREREPHAAIDDLLAKPFPLDELDDRIRTVLLRRHRRDDGVFRLGELFIDPPRRKVMVRDDDWSRPVILDLGLVRDMLGDSLTAYPDLMGTVPYMSPEQLRKEKAVKRSDIFSAGVTLYLLLTKGKHPFIAAGETVAIEVLEERIRDEDWPKWEEAEGMCEGVREVLELFTEARRLPTSPR